MISFVGLAAWVNFFKLANRRWRFEFFTFDFLFGLLTVAVVGAFTLGNFGSDLGLGDRLLVASKTSEAMSFLAGCLLGLGLLALFAAIRLTGITAALTIAFSLAALLAASVTLASNSLLTSALSMALLFAAILVGAKATRGQDAPAKIVKNPRQPPPFNLRQSSKGILLAIAGGFFLGGALPALFSAVGGDFGVGPYAGLLVTSVGALLTALTFSVESVTSVASQPDLGATVSLVIAAACGIIFWGETKLTKSSGILLAATALFACGAVCGALASSL